jgi:hypothetical protein
MLPRKTITATTCRSFSARYICWHPLGVMPERVPSR